MEKSEIIFLASKSISKFWSYEQLKYGDDLHSVDRDNLDDIVDEIWEYVEEHYEIGDKAFREKYKEYKLY
ncbi:hypothetical protein [Elizabethkingia anophelis]|uniref:hypothetical protein n=1 Tax=Elizabethkingia anophelis TaxID=1117645 RepID=UPI00389190E6